MTGTAQPLRSTKIVVGVCGGIAAYKAVELVRLLVQAGAQVQVVMTEAARHFVGELTFQTLTGRAVFTDMFSLTQESEIGHIGAAEGADLVIVAPATANTIARLSAGLANDALAAVVLATDAPLLLAPSMNTKMWDNPVTQRNLDRLRRLTGASVVGPGTGFLACKTTGPGRLAEPAEIVEAAAHVLSDPDLTGTRLVVSAGPTREPIDPVRYLSNRSSGKMGYALARAAARRGSSVVLVSGPVALEPPLGVELRSVLTAAEMARAVSVAAADADAVIMAAAVADFRPASVAGDKLKKAELVAGAGASAKPGSEWGQALAGGAAADGTVALSLVGTTDILASLGQERAARGADRPLLIGFAAETSAPVDHARAKLAGKRCDVVVANDVSQPDAGFEVDTNRVALVEPDRVHSLELASKDEIAHAILDRVVALLEERGGTAAGSGAGSRDR